MTREARQPNRSGPDDGLDVDWSARQESGVSAWNFMQVELRPADMLLTSMVGPGGLSRVEAHAEIRGLLDRHPALAATAAIWRQGAVDDTVYAGPFTWVIYEHDQGEDPRRAALVWLEDFASTMRAAGLDVTVAALP